MAEIPDAEGGRQAPLTSALYLPEAVVEHIRALGHHTKKSKIPQRERNSSSGKKHTCDSRTRFWADGIADSACIITKSCEILSQDGFIAKTGKHIAMNRVMPIVCIHSRMQPRISVQIQPGTRKGVSSSGW